LFQAALKIVDGRLPLLALSEEGELPIVDIVADLELDGLTYLTWYSLPDCDGIAHSLLLIQCYW
jgi:hypothetical protein